MPHPPALHPPPRHLGTPFTAGTLWVLLRRREGGLNWNALSNLLPATKEQKGKRVARNEPGDGLRSRGEARRGEMAAGYNGLMIDASWYVRPDPGAKVKDRVSAGGIIVRRDADGVIWLALTCGEGSVGDSYILPKGGVDPGEEIEQAARREIEEEAGFSQLRLLESLGTRERLSFDKRRWITTHYFLYATEELEPKPTDPNYAYVTHWFALDQPLPELFWPEQRALIEESRERIREKLT